MTLTFQPGVTFRCRDAWTSFGIELRVRGNFDAPGAISQTITLAGRSDDNSGLNWGGLVFNGGTGRLRNVHINYASAGNSIISSDHSIANVPTVKVRLEHYTRQ